MITLLVILLILIIYLMLWMRITTIAKEGDDE